MSSLSLGLPLVCGLVCSTAQGRASLVGHAPASPAALANRPSRMPGEQVPGGRHRFGYEDLVRIHKVSDPQLSPDGHKVCFVRGIPDPDRNLTQTAIYCAPASAPKGTSGASELRQLTFPPAPQKGKPTIRDHSPRFAPDGQSLAFISNRDGSDQLYLLDLRGGEARLLTQLPGGAAVPVFAPDGTAIVVQTAIAPECPVLPQGLGCNRERAEVLEAGPLKVRVMERLFYRHWDSWYDGRRSHLVRIALSPSKTGAPVIDLTPGDLDSPSIARAGDGPYVISPDGKEMAVVQNRDRELATSTNNDIVVYPLPQGKPVNLTAANPATDMMPRYSPDGRYLAYLAQARPGFEADRWVLFLYDRKERTRRPLTDSLDAHIEEIAWSKDSQKIYFTTTLLGHGRIYQVGLDGAISAPIYTGDASHLQIAPDGSSIVFLGSSLGRSQEIYQIHLAGGSEKAKVVPLTGVNDGAFANLSMGKVSELWGKTADDRRLHSYLITPPGFEPGKKYPAVVLIHGGPQGAWVDGWHFRWNPQVYAGAGYVVLMVNPRGSEGYGQRFVDEVSGDWGGRAYDDVMRAVDQLAALPYVDSKRIGALGASYGGYMVNWIAGHTDRFAALVSHDGVYDPRSMMGETEEIWFPRWEFLGDPWTSDLYEKWNPARFAGKFKTPMLVITNERDYRVPVGQGMQLFTALQLRKVPSKMVIFPDENHWVVKPGNSRFWHATVLDWLSRYLGGTPVDEKMLRVAASHAR